MKKDEAMKLALDWYDSGNENREEFKQLISTLLDAVVEDALTAPPLNGRLENAWRST